MSSNHIHHETPKNENPSKTGDTGIPDHLGVTPGVDYDTQAVQILAGTKPRDVERMLSDIHAKRILKLPMPHDVAELSLAIDKRTHLAARGITRKALATGALVGILFGGYEAWDVGRVKYDMRDGLHSLPNEVPGQIFEGNVLTSEGTITIPGTRLRLPDPTSLTYGELVTHKLKNVEHHATTVSTVDRMAENPFGLGLKLQGNERELDAAALRPVIRDIGEKGGKITKVVIRGLVSDDFNNASLGKKDPEQHKLAVDRANAGLAALQDVSREEGLKLPKDVNTLASEAVLSEQEIAKINRIAKELDMSTHELLSAYNSGEDLPEHAKTVLQDTIVRGVKYDFSYDTSTTSSSYELVPAGKQKDSIKPWQVATIFGGLTTMIVSGYGWMARAMRIPRVRRKQAKKDLKKQKK